MKNQIKTQSKRAGGRGHRACRCSSRLSARYAPLVIRRPPTSSAGAARPSHHDSVVFSVPPAQTNASSHVELPFQSFVFASFKNTLTASEIRSNETPTVSRHDNSVECALDPAELAVSLLKRWVVVKRRLAFLCPSRQGFETVRQTPNPHGE